MANHKFQCECCGHEFGENEPSNSCKCFQRPTAQEVAEQIEEMHPDSLFIQQLEWGEKMIVQFVELGPQKAIGVSYGHRNRDTGNGINWG